MRQIFHITAHEHHAEGVRTPPFYRLNVHAPSHALLEHRWGPLPLFGKYRLTRLVRLSAIGDDLRIFRTAAPTSRTHAEKNVGAAREVPRLLAHMHHTQRDALAARPISFSEGDGVCRKSPAQVATSVSQAVIQKSGGLKPIKGGMPDRMFAVISASSGKLSIVKGGSAVVGGATFWNRR